ncbi:AraC family transcriptional regulator [Herbivorax sp. ANBcel31]|uniref:AraC family transcriptional regulator n=1 Tax=Herbivorax sp. ANBcel31 TaxID=3069754 RepID=UPI0027B57CE9|nr:AraC family transcriptional regulator [Herbivorax sp. ANBcel31]MDQ2084948.1 AraC family transcriptional regulator [Herbivorax sp. ANBcel31]
MNYYQRIQDTIDYIDENLNEEITLDELAKISCLSKYYFHRMFSAMAGEPVMSYIRKRRLGRAVKQLNNTSLRIIDIALDNKFESQEVFIRAFVKHFGITPARYRKLKTKVQISDKISLLGINNNSKSGIQPKIVIHEAKKAVGMKLFTTLRENAEKSTIEKFHSKVFKKRIDEIQGKVKANIIYGICENGYKDEDTLIHTVCVEVGNNYTVPKGMEEFELIYSRYLVFSHTGSAKEVANTYGYIYKDWLPCSGYELSKTGRDLQIYDQTKTTLGNSNVEMDICVPID